MIPRYLSKSQLSELTGKDRRTINKLLEGIEPHSVTANAQRYDAQIALKAIYESRTAKGIADKIIKEQLRYESARADKIELEVQKRRGELVEIEKVAAIVEREYTAVRAAILSLPIKMAHVLAPVDQPTEIKRHLEEAVNEVLIELSADIKYAEENPIEDIDGYDDESSDEITEEPTDDIETETEAQPS